MIGIFDSGVGGLSVLKAIREKAPSADIVCFGDTENAPYGHKRKRQVSVLVAMALRRLYAEGAQEIVSACNTTSVSVLSVPIDLLRLRLFDVVEMIEPTVAALAPLCEQTGKQIAILGTRATIQSGMYRHAFRERGVSVHSVAIPDLATLIETGAPRDAVYPAVKAAVEDALSKGAEILSLSCTHYPLVQDVFEECVREAGGRPNVMVFDPSDAAAREVVSRFSTEGKGILRFLVSKESPVFNSYVEQLFGNEPHSIELTDSIYHTLKTV